MTTSDAYRRPRVVIPAAKMIHALRQAAKLSGRKLAQQAGISSTYLHRFETGCLDSAPSEEVLTRIAQALGVAPDDLLVAAGRVPQDVVHYLLRYPELCDLVREEAKKRS